MSNPDTANGYVEAVEQEVLGALLFGGDFRKVAGILSEEHFVFDLHRVLFAAIKSAYDRYGSTKMPTVLPLVPSTSHDSFVARTGVPAAQYMASLSECTVTGGAGLDKSAKAVLEQWARIKAGEVAGIAQAASLDPSADPRALLRGVAEEYDAISAELRRGPRRKTSYTLGEAARMALDETKAAMSRGSGLTGVTWGLADVNRMTGGMQRGEMIVLGARPSMGKSAVALSVGLRSARSNVGTGFISLEMGSTRLAQRAMTDLAYDWGVEVQYTDLITGKVSAEKLEALQAANTDLERLPLFIEEQDGLSLSDIRVKLERMLEQSEQMGAPMGLLIVDYLQLIKPSTRYSGNRNNEITEISAGLRGFAREYNLAVLALSQLSRSIESRPIHERRPIMSDLRDSGAIEQDADTIIFLFREAYYLEKEKGKDQAAEDARIDRLIDVQNKLEFIISKQRNGPVGTVNLFCDIACSAVRNGARF